MIAKNIAIIANVCYWLCQIPILKNRVSKGFDFDEFAGKNKR